jgi:hypothetical protein
MNAEGDTTVLEHAAVVAVVFWEHLHVSMFARLQRVLFSYRVRDKI